MNAWSSELHESSSRRTGAGRALFAFLGASGGLLLLGGMFNIVVVATGARDVMAVPLAVAFGFAAMLLLLQYIIGSKIAGNGVLGVGYVLAYLALVSFNTVLATGGVTSLGFSDRLGQAGFERSVAQVLPEVANVAAAYRAISQRLDSLSGYSSGRAAEEAGNGRTCGPSDPGEGPIYRLRIRDRDAFAALSRTFSALSIQMSAARQQIETDVAGYQAARHEEIARRVNAALATARDGANNPALDTMRREVSARRAAIGAGMRDVESGAMVVCPDDPLERELEAVLAAPVPEVPEAEELPARPSHDTAVVALVEAILDSLGGSAFNWSLWAVPLLIGSVPDAIFMLGLAQARRDRRARLGLVGGLGERKAGSPCSLEALAAAAQGAAGSVTLNRLATFHHRRVRRIGVTDYLVIPADPEHLSDYLVARRLVMGHLARYAGLGPAGNLDPVAVPAVDQADRARLCHFFVMCRGAWDALFMDVLDLHLRNSRGDDALRAARQ